MRITAPSRGEVRFVELVEMVGTIAKCGECKKLGFIAEVGVQSEPVLRKRRYFAEWNHPDPDGDSTTIHEVWWR